MSGRWQLGLFWKGNPACQGSPGGPVPAGGGGECQPGRGKPGCPPEPPGGRRWAPLRKASRLGAIGPGDLAIAGYACKVGTAHRPPLQCPDRAQGDPGDPSRCAPPPARRGPLTCSHTSASRAPARRRDLSAHWEGGHRGGEAPPARSRQA